MERFYKYCIISIIFGALLLFLSVLISVSWLGILGYFVGAAGLLCLMVTTKTGLVILACVATLFVLGLLICFGPVQFVKVTQDLIFYNNNKDSVVEVSAAITDIEEKADGDGGTDYVAYVSYEYDNKTYHNVRWKNVDGEHQLNTEVSVRISPEKPDEIFGSGHVLIISVIWTLLVTVVGVVVIIGFCVMLSKIKQREQRLTQ